MILSRPSGQEGVFTDKPEGVLFRARFRPRLVRDSARDPECPPRPGGDVGPLEASVPRPGPSLHGHRVPALPAPSGWQRLLPGSASLAAAVPASRPLGRAAAGLGRPLHPSGTPHGGGRVGEPLVQRRGGPLSTGVCQDSL